MLNRIHRSLALAALAVLTLGSALWAADPVPTAITVPDMHCMGCATKMAKQIYAVPGVAKVQANVEASKLTVLPMVQRILSPRALWEAVERAGFKPSKLEGPSGTFTKKPQS